MKGTTKLFILCFTSSFSFITCPFPISYTRYSMGSSHGYESDEAPLDSSSILNSGSARYSFAHGDDEADEDLRHTPFITNPGFSSRYSYVPLLHDGGALSGREIFHRPTNSVSPMAGISRPSLDISRIFGLLDQIDTIKPNKETSTLTSKTASIPKVDPNESVKEVEKRLKLAPVVTQNTNNQKLKELAGSTLFEDFIADVILLNVNVGFSQKTFSSNSGEISQCKQKIKSILEVLEQDHLEFRERIWMLGILKSIQPSLSMKDGKILHVSFQQGSLCRGEFELFLNKNADLAASAINLWKQDKDHIETDSTILESVERVELFLKLYEYLQTTKSKKKSPKFITIYNTLLQASSPIPEEIISILMRKCQFQMVGDIQESEIIAVYHIITHLQKHCKEVIESLDKKIIINPIFESVLASLRKDFEYQEKVKPDIKRFFGTENGDPYMENLVAPLIGWSKVDVTYYDYVLNSLKAYEYEQSKSKHQDTHNTAMYMINKKEVIGILSKASDYIRGAKKVMNQENSTISNDDMECDSKDVPQFEKKGEAEEVICSICLQDLINGQHILKLNCSEKHLYHQDCIQIY
ncbi:hypothetical protein DFH28DRAFT_286790 [Melampsora americana]|nr:hypothetical protein DFH28DRAFT_286790 [Melampsora americana]